MANSLNDEVVSFDSALREASVFRNLIFLVHQSRKKKETIATLVLERIYCPCCQMALGKA